MLRVATVLLLAVLPGTLATVQQRKPVRDEPINTSFKAPPPTLGAMISEAELVVFGRFVGGAVKDSDDPGKGRSTMTGHRLKIGEVLHASSSSRKVGSEIEVIRRGGERDRGSYIERSYQIGFPPFQNGHEYALFLVWNTALDAWVPAYGPDSAIDLTGAAAHSAGQSDLIRSLEGKPAAEVLELLRRSGR